MYGRYSGDDIEQAKKASVYEFMRPTRSADRYVPAVRLRSGKVVFVWESPYTAGNAIPWSRDSFEEPQPGCGGYRGDDLDTAKKMSVYACNCDERVRIEGRVPAVRFRTGEVLWCVTREAAS